MDTNSSEIYYIVQSVLSSPVVYEGRIFPLKPITVNEVLFDQFTLGVLSGGSPKGVVSIAVCKRP